MATDVLSETFNSKMRLTTKTVGEDRIKRAKDNNEDIAVLSMFLPGEKTPFKCHMGSRCEIGENTIGKAGISNRKLIFYFIICIFFSGKYFF